MPLKLLIALLIFGLSARAAADSYHLINTAVSGLAVNTGEFMQVTTTGNSGFTPTKTFSGTPAYFTPPPTPESTPPELGR